jgi:putative endonuclease
MFVYILTNAHGTLYIGVTSDLASRMAYHADMSYKSFARRYNCDRLIFVEYVEDYASAIRREKRLKGWRRAKKVALICTANPGWATIPVG